MHTHALHSHSFPDEIRGKNNPKAAITHRTSIKSSALLILIMTKTERQNKLILELDVTPLSSNTIVLTPIYKKSIELCGVHNEDPSCVGGGST